MKLFSQYQYIIFFACLINKIMIHICMMYLIHLFDPLYSLYRRTPYLFLHNCSTNIYEVYVISSSVKYSSINVMSCFLCTRVQVVVVFLTSRMVLFVSLIKTHNNLYHTLFGTIASNTGASTSSVTV